MTNIHSNKKIVVTGGNGRFAQVLKKENKKLNIFFPPKKNRGSKTSKHLNNETLENPLGFIGTIIGKYAMIVMAVFCQNMEQYNFKSRLNVLIGVFSFTSNS